MKHRTLRSDYLPTPQKIGNGNPNKMRGKWRSPTGRRSNPPAVTKQLRGRAKRLSTAPNNAFKVTLRNSKVATRQKPPREPVYQFKKYLEAVKEADNVRVPVTKRLAPAKHTKPQRAVTKSTERIGARSASVQVIADEDTDMDGASIDFAEDIRIPERQVRVVRTVTAAPERSNQSTSVKSRLTINRRNTKNSFRSRNGANPSQPPARLFWQSVS